MICFGMRRDKSLKQFAKTFVDQNCDEPRIGTCKNVQNMQVRAL